MTIPLALESLWTKWSSPRLTWDPLSKRENVTTTLWRNLIPLCNLTDLSCFSSFFFPSSTFSGLLSHGSTATLHSLSKMSSSWQTTWLSSPVSSRGREYLETWMLLKEVLMPYYRLQFARSVRIHTKNILLFLNFSGNNRLVTWS